MIYEIAQLPLRKNHIEAFRKAFADVVPLLSQAKGYCGHLLAQGVETPEMFHLIVSWHALEDHTAGFETSENHRMFILGLREHFADEPTVYHIKGEDFSSVTMKTQTLD